MSRSAASSPSGAAAAAPFPPPPLPLQPPFGPDAGPGGGQAELKPVRRFIPDSWKNFFKGRRGRASGWDGATSDIGFVSDGTPCSPPASPGPWRARPGCSAERCAGSGGSCRSQEADAMLRGDSSGAPTGMTYSEQVEAYRQRYAYMKSWAGLLRLLGVAELLLGAAVFACVTAYVHKDNEWYNVFGYSQPYSYGTSYGGGLCYYHALVSLKLWRHEAARRQKEEMEREVGRGGPFGGHSCQVCCMALKGTSRIMKLQPPCYMKYPAIQTNEMRDRYKAVFNDQFAEYKELSVEVHAVLKKFSELEALMRQLPQHPGSIYEQERISKVLQEYEKKKNDPAFLEKKERCEYLKNKLSHIKQRIQDYDKVMNWKVQI
uniref:MARVEL domain containing 2 n=1 Tax=Phasianus colchicus TaxID=9054 RepID=A0A669QQ30_PHACC